jgi:hypothetical protein
VTRFATPALDGRGLRDHLLARPAGWASLSGSHRAAVQTHLAPPSGWVKDCHLQAADHARHIRRPHGKARQVVNLQASEGRSGSIVSRPAPSFERQDNREPARNVVGRQASGPRSARALRSPARWGSPKFSPQRPGAARETREGGRRPQPLRSCQTGGTRSHPSRARTPPHRTWVLK